MIAACFEATAPQQLPIGTSADGRHVYAPFRPTAAQLAHLDGIARAGDVLPLPNGMTLVKSGFDGQLQLILSETYARRLRRAYGYIGEIKLVWFITLFSFGCFPGGLVASAGMVKGRIPQICCK